jgi:PEGA domain
MEYIYVHFDPNEVRDVLADGNVIGQTETEITLPANYYVITLSGDGYAPADWSGLVSGTVPGNPLRIFFSRS